MSPIRPLLAASVVLFATSVTRADVVAYWSFNALGEKPTVEADQAATATKPTITLFGGSLVAAGQKGEGTTIEDGAKYAAGQAAAWDRGVNDEGPNGLTLAFDASEYEGLMLKFHCRSTKTGAPTVTVEYRVGTNEFTSVAKDVALVGDTAFHPMTVDLSKATGLAGAKAVEVRLVFGEGKSNGTTRIDNVELTGKKPN